MGKSKKNNRLGERRLNNQNLYMEIVEYTNCDNITIKFDDGFIIRNRTYGAFIKGNIKHPNYPNCQIIDRTGEINISNEGYLMIIDEYRSNEDIDIIFENGIRVCNRLYRDFKDGKVRNPINNLAYSKPDVANMIAIPENNITFFDCYDIANGKNEYYYIKCLKCGCISSKKKNLNKITSRGYYSCEYCHDGISVPEKLFDNILYQLKEQGQIDSYKNRVRSNTLVWAKDYEYDFYVTKGSITYIFETHGEQHYEENTNWDMTLEEQQENDKNKRMLALDNNIDIYEEIDCRESTLKWLKENIIKNINDIFDLSNIDWDSAWKSSQKSKCIEAWELWNSGYPIGEISILLNISNTTIRDYLYKGVECNKCDYTSEESMKRGHLLRIKRNNS